MFDPLGLVNPAIVSARILVQKCWEMGIQWKPSLPQDMVEEWKENVKEISQSLKLQHDRFIGITNLEDVSLHVFGDAGEKLIGVVAYLVSRT